MQLNTLKAPANVLMVQLRELQINHPLWENPLFKTLKSGNLNLKDLQFIFGQYFFYSHNFTRYLAAFMANSDNDLHRALLVENLWEESGAIDLSQRHPELFRRFLTQGLGIDLNELKPIPATQLFVNEVLDFCIKSPAIESSVFLSLGTEGIVSHMYEIFLTGLKKAGVPDQYLAFFQIHIACDDNHAETLEKIVLSYAGEPGWFEICCRTLSHALDLRDQYFSQLYQALQTWRIQTTLDRIQGRKSLSGIQQRLSYPVEQPGTILYQNNGDANHKDIDFTVERFGFNSEVLDSRLVRIAPQKTNERHRHAHEALFFIKAGQGTVYIDQEQIKCKTGDIVFVPRWAVHQVENTGPDELLFLAVTDFGLTSKAFIGNYLKTARIHASQDADHAILAKH
jgi:quercetin dioxygenase-like cupin family protein/pyrroloquinoline quinone (PQQ) biosynthesis protein C